MYGIVLLGMPGSGKSSIGKELAKRYDYKYISSGDIAREMAASDDAIRNNLNMGMLAPEHRMRIEIGNKILLYKCNDSNFILDGFPRFPDQDKWLSQMFDVRLIKVHIYVPEFEALQRGLMRGREDDTALMDRIKYYKSVTYPLTINADITINNDKDIDSAVKLIHTGVIKRVNNR